MTLGELLTEGYERVYDEIREGDMIRTLGGISQANDKWIGARLEEMGAAARTVEIWRKPRLSKMTQQEVIQHVCETVSLAYNSLDDYTEPSDGFCHKCPNAGTTNFRHSGKTLRFVRDAVLEKLKREGVAIAPGYDPLTGDSLPIESLDP